jgi:hypothetical protein
MSSRVELGSEAAIALGIASTAMGFALTPQESAEQWLRILRLHGKAGVALQALGVAEGRLKTTPAGPPQTEPLDQETGEQMLRQVTDAAFATAAGREDPVHRPAHITTTDLLLAVMDVYGEHFDKALEAHGAQRDELLERLDVSADRR